MSRCEWKAILATALVGVLNCKPSGSPPKAEPRPPLTQIQRVAPPTASAAGDGPNSTFCRESNRFFIVFSEGWEGQGTEVIVKTKSALDAPFKCVKESSKEDFHLAADDGQPKCFGAIEGDFLIMKMCAQGFGMEHLFVYDLGKGKEVWKSEFGGDFSEIRTTPEGVRYQKPTGKRPTPANCSAMLDPNRNVTTTPGFGWLEAEDVTYRFADAKLVSTGAKSCFYLEDGG